MKLSKIVVLTVPCLVILALTFGLIPMLFNMSATAAKLMLWWIVIVDVITVTLTFCLFKLLSR